MSNPAPAAFLDRDGTLIEDYPDEQWSGRRAPVWLPGALEAVRELDLLGYRIVIITNQYIIGEKFITRDDYEALTKAMRAALRAAGVRNVAIFHCPHPRWEPCACSKPGRGLIDQALADQPHLDLTTSVLVGDSDTDVALGLDLGIRTFGIKTTKSELRATHVGSLRDVATILREEHLCAD